jgi:dipeptidase E
MCKICGKKSKIGEDFFGFVCYSSHECYFFHRRKWKNARLAKEDLRETIMKFLLTSAGIKNTSINDALVGLLGKPIAESSALCIPTASYAHPGGAAAAWRFISGRSSTPMCELGWKSLGVLELTALPSIDQELWVPMVQETDVLLVNGGDALYLCYWMRQSGLADLLPSLRDAVYVGLSAGSMVLTPTFGKAYDGSFCRDPPAPANNLPIADDHALGLVDFSIFPHVDHERFPENSMANAEKWAATVPVPTYAIDDQTALKVIDGAVEVVSEGHWKRFTP